MVKDIPENWTKVILFTDIAGEIINFPITITEWNVQIHIDENQK